MEDSTTTFTSGLESIQVRYSDCYAVPYSLSFDLSEETVTALRNIVASEFHEKSLVVEY